MNIDEGENNSGTDQAKPLGNDSRQTKPSVYPELSPGYMVLLKWLTLIFVAFVIWAVFNSGYA